MSTELTKESGQGLLESNPTKAHPNWGGRRKGAGRKPISDKAFGSTILIRVSDEQKQYFRQKGSSSWVRSLIEESMQQEFEALNSSEVAECALPDGALPVIPRLRVSVPMGAYSVQAGFPSPAESYKESLDFNELLIDNQPATFVMRVAGQSMVDAGLDDGDLIVVDRSRVPASGDIVVMRINNEYTVKRFIKNADSIYLKAENSTGLYKDIYPVEGEEWVCFGVVNYSIKPYSGKKLG